MASKAFVSREDVEDYLVKGSTEARVVGGFVGGAEVNVNAPGGRAEMRALVSGLRKVAEGVERDTGILTRPS